MYKEKKNGSVNFHASVPTYKPPVIVDQFCDDDGELVYVLANGNTSLAKLYNNLWNPTKGIINMQSKGERIGSPNQIY